MTHNKLISYIKGEITSDADVKEILDWIESSSENQNTYNQLKNLWVATGLDHPDSVNIPIFRFHRTSTFYHRKTIFHAFFKYAAVFALAYIMGGLSFYFLRSHQQNGLSNLYNSIEVPYGERSQLTLYDGTKVWLNSGTKFRYPVAFSSTTRDVFMEGEAYFDVAKDAKHPFIVQAGKLKVEVFGTHFDVCAYPDDKDFTTTLEEGSINAYNIESGANMKLAPGEQAVLNRETNKIKQLIVNTDLFTSWKENLLKFEDAPFEDVIKKMERWYDVKISVDPSINKQERYTMTIKTESLREMLQLVAKTTPMKYEIKANSVQIKKP